MQNTTRRQTGASTAAAGALARQSNPARKQGAARRRRIGDMDASTALAFPLIKAPFYLTLARRGQYLKVVASDTSGLLEVITAEASYLISTTEKDKADRALARERDRLKDTRPGRAFLCAVQLALTGKEVAA